MLRRYRKRLGATFTGRYGYIVPEDVTRGACTTSSHTYRPIYHTGAVHNQFSIFFDHHIHPHVLSTPLHQVALVSLTASARSLEWHRPRTFYRIPQYHMPPSLGPPLRRRLKRAMSSDSYVPDDDEDAISTELEDVLHTRPRKKAKKAAPDDLPKLSPLSSKRSTVDPASKDRLPGSPTGTKTAKPREKKTNPKPRNAKPCKQ